MNLLSLVMGLLLIFACTFSLSLSKQSQEQQVQKTYLAHIKASHQVRNSYESLCYERMRGEKKESLASTNQPQEPKKKKIEPINLSCARLNLWPLITEGKEKHLVLYETAAGILHSLYQPLSDGKSPRFHYQLLDAIIEAARLIKQKPGPIMLEKLQLAEFNVKQLYSMQAVYYQMLKGTPSLLECVEINSEPSKICLQHASLSMLSALFGVQSAQMIAKEMQENETDLSAEKVQEICSQNGRCNLDEEFLKLIDFNTSRHHLCGQKTIVQEEANVTIKQKVYLPS